MLNSKILEELKKVNVNLEYQTKLLETLVEDISPKRPPGDIPIQMQNMMNGVIEMVGQHPGFKKNPEALDVMRLVINGMKNMNGGKIDGRKPPQSLPK